MQGQTNVRLNEMTKFSFKFVQKLTRIGIVTLALWSIIIIINLLTTHDDAITRLIYKF